MMRSIWLAPLLTGCMQLAVLTAPDKAARPTEGGDSKEAHDLFWSILHRGEYERIGEGLERLKAIYAANPNDALAAAHIGFLHAWSVNERRRLPKTPASIIDHAILARRYFEEAVRLDPSDERYQGFYGDFLMIEGQIHGDEAMIRRGYFTTKESVERWFTFNAFTLGYLLSDKPKDDPLYADALELMWRTNEECWSGYDRAVHDIAAALPLEAQESDPKKKRACWNSWIAPHNLEGYLLNQGDMLVKSGDWRTAQKIYASARQVPSYGAWPYVFLGSGAGNVIRWC